MVITDIFKNRWRTLMSVDDVVAAVIAEVDALGLSDSTYFFYSSDHGFQVLGRVDSSLRRCGCCGDGGGGGGCGGGGCGCGCCGCWC